MKDKIPELLYGTAWKEEETERLTFMAIEAGFRGIDTANQAKHYNEAGVGSAVKRAIKDGIASREDLFIQSKFTFAEGQDQRIPYDRNAPVGEQVRQSFSSSLEHLGTEYIDSYVLHGPKMRFGLSKDDWEAWHAMEDAYSVGFAKHIGISNVALDQLSNLVKDANVKPEFVQNRCFAQAGWDMAVRRFCRENDIIYQGFSLLTANAVVMSDNGVRDLAGRHGATPAQMIFAFARQVGMLPLTGTKSREHMDQDLASRELELSGDELMFIEEILVYK